MCPPDPTEESAAAQVGDNLTIDSYGSNDAENDSAYDSELASYTTSVASEITDYKFKGGRRYHAYKEGSYPLPNDEKESDRLDIMHKMLEVAMRGKLHFAPLKDPKRILDLGTGTGIWAMDAGDKYPDADVLGNDLSPIQPKWVPPNVTFEVDDIESPWTYQKKFDLIHSRLLNSAIRDWPALVKNCYNFVHPGAYAEFTDLDITARSPDDTLPYDSPLAMQNRTMIEVSSAAGVEPNPGLHLKKWLTEAGFEDVTETVLPMPIGTWPKDKHLKTIGSWNFTQVNEGIEGFCTYLFMNQLGWSQEEVSVLAAKIRRQIRDPKCHVYITLYNVYGRKPVDANEAD